MPAPTSRKVSLTLSILYRLTIVALLLLTAPVCSGTENHTAFVYTGTLELPETFKSASLDMQFSIYGMESDQEPLWQSDIYKNVAIQDGRIRVTLDPGNMEIYQQAPLKMAIAVRPGGSDGVFTLLNDRPEVTYLPVGIKVSKFRGKSFSEKIWICIGLLGQLFFTARFLVQWIATERAKKSVVPDSFWIFSVIGCSTVLLYAFYRQDPVFILAYLFNNLIYIRNLIFINRHKKLKDNTVAPETVSKKDCPECQTVTDFNSVGQQDKPHSNSNPKRCHCQH